MNLASWIIVAVLVAVCALIIRSLRKKGVVCDGGCSGCSGCKGCSANQCNISGKSA